MPETPGAEDSDSVARTRVERENLPGEGVGNARALENVIFGLLDGIVAGQRLGRLVVVHGDKVPLGDLIPTPA